MARRDAQPIIRHVARERDEQVLEWIRLRKNGVTTTKIAQRFGVSSASVVLAINAVRDADAEESGERVGGAYW